MDGRTESPDTADAFIEVTRRRPIYFGLIGPSYSVYIDDIPVGTAPRGRKVRFVVTPGDHKVKVWTSTGKARSNELGLSLTSGSVRSLVCQINKTAFPIGISQARAQIKTIRNLVKNRGVQVNAILLTEATL